MAFQDYDEYEQGELVRKWIRENGIAVVAGVVLALVLVFGWRQWQAHRTGHQIQAASQFAVLGNAIQAHNQQGMTTALEQLQKEYANTPYAAFGSAAAAGYAAGQNDLKTAAQDLQWAVSHSDHPALKQLFTLRLARVLLAQNQPQQALTALDGIPDKNYATIAAELHGDAELKLGKPDAARNSYRAAMAGLDPDAPGRAALQMKIDNLPKPAPATSGSQPR